MEEATSRTTLFVSKIPAALLNEQQLKTLFEKHGKVETCYLLNEKASAFLRFADFHSAQSAIDGLDKKDFNVTWAKRRDRSQPKQDKSPAKILPPRPPIPKYDLEPFELKCVVVAHLIASGQVTDEEVNKAIYKKSKRILASLPQSATERQLKVEFPIENKASSSKIAHIHAPTPRLAFQLAGKLNNHIIKSHLLATHLLNQGQAALRKGRNAAGGRLVIRNLAFQVSSQDLLATFCPFGPVLEIDLPLETNGRAKGFAFVWFLAREDAEQAINKVNGKVISAGAAEERIKEGGEGKKQTRQRLKKEQPEKVSGRVVAVDWALSKDAWEAAQKGSKVEEDVDMTASDQKEKADASQKKLSSDSDEEESEGNEEDDGSMPEELISGSSESESDQDQEQEEEQDSHLGNSADKQSQKQPVGTTLFVRNVQFEATEDELYTLFKAFGAVRYARIVTDPDTKRSRGTGFVCFYNKADADRVLALSEKSQMNESERPIANPFSQPSILSADPSSSTIASLSLHGRVVGVSEAVTRESADKLREDRDRKSGKVDRRNLYLLREGVSEEDSETHKDLTKPDQEARATSFESRKKLLRTNPSLYVSRTRLSIRQLPLFVTDQLLKRLALYGAKDFNQQYKDGKREGLTAVEMQPEAADDVLGAAPTVAKAKIKKDGTAIPPSRIRQAKVLRQSDRLDPFSGLGRSKGYGFLDLASHADALRVLRWLNFNHGVGQLLRTWWREDLSKQIVVLAKDTAMTEDERNGKLERLRGKVAELDADAKRDGSRMTRTVIAEFSIENVQTVKRREKRAQDFQAKAKSRPAEDATPSRKRKAAAEPAVPSKKAKREEEANPLGKMIGRKRKARKAKGN